MGSRLFRRRVTAAVGIYGAAALGITGTLIAANELGSTLFGLLSIVTMVTGFFQTLFDFTVEEVLVKYGFRYSTQERWGRLQRLFRVAIRLKLLGGLIAALVLVAVAPVADSLFSGHHLAVPFLLAAPIPLLQSPEGVAGAALMLRSRYDLRGLFLLYSMSLRFVALVVGASFGVTQTVIGLLIAQALAIFGIGTAGLVVFRSFPRVQSDPLAEEKREIVAFAFKSSIATGVVSLRGLVSGLLLALVSVPRQVGFFRTAQAPQTAFATLSAPARMVLLAEQTRDWEEGKKENVFRGVRRYTLWAAIGMALVLPPLVWFTPDLISLILGKSFLGASSAARLIFLAAGLQLVVGWSKSFPVSIGRPELRIWTHGVESLVLIPLVLILGAAYGATGAGIATLASSGVFALFWALLYTRIRTASRAAAAVQRLPESESDRATP
jgi:O-antigen/teichoic acid export membrane protein